VARLEEQLGSRLLERTTRRLRLTDAGESLYREVSRPLAQLREVAVDALAQGAQVQGTLRVAAPYEFGAHHLAPVACAVMARHPMLKVHIDVEHARVALFDRNYDIVFSSLQHAAAPSTVVTRRVFSLERGPVRGARPARAGTAPATPEELDALPLLAGADDQRWTFTAPDGATSHVEVRNPRLRSGNASVRMEAALAGLGVARITATFCAAAVAAGRLVRLLPDHANEPLRIHAMLPSRRLVPAKVRTFLDALERGRGAPAGLRLERGLGR
jgi:DNA-binding transcriptional LysR family regulator